MVGGGRPLLPEILGRTARPRYKNGDFHSIFARTGSTVGASGKSSIMTNRSSVRASNEPKMNSLAPKSPKGGLKGDNFVVSVLKIDFARRMSAAKFVRVKTVSGKVVRHSLAYPSVQKWLVGDVSRCNLPLLQWSLATVATM